MKTAIIIHGWPGKEDFFNKERPSPSNNQWLPWLQKELLVKGINAQTPEMPDSYLPVYEKWKTVFEQFIIDEETILVGHSCGGGFLIRWLSETNTRVGKVVLVAPWIDPTKELDTHFFDFIIDENLVSKTAGLGIMYSTDDESHILDSIKILKEKIKDVFFHEYTNKGHFCIEDLRTNKLPEILEILFKE